MNYHNMQVMVNWLDSEKLIFPYSNAESSWVFFFVIVVVVFTKEASLLNSMLQGPVMPTAQDSVWYTVGAQNLNE